MTDSQAPENVDSIDTEQILKMLPHRYPMLLVDKLVDVVTNESAVGIKNVSINEPFFQGHFPTSPVMPGVLIVETMAQTAAVLVVHSLGDQTEGSLVYFMSIDNARFRKPVRPGDCMRLPVTKQRQRGNVWKFSCLAEVEGQTVAEATITAMIAPE